MYTMEDDERNYVEWKMMKRTMFRVEDDESEWRPRLLFPSNTKKKGGIRPLEWRIYWDPPSHESKFTRLEWEVRGGGEPQHAVLIL
jgi:hypothetical protein